GVIIHILKKFTVTFVLLFSLCQNIFQCIYFVFSSSKTSPLIFHIIFISLVCILLFGISTFPFFSFFLFFFYQFSLFNHPLKQIYFALYICYFVLICFCG